MIYKKLKLKGQGLPINVVVMMIIGIIIFGLGMGLFSKFSNSGNDEIEQLNQKVKTDIASLECEGDEWICSPSNTIKKGNIETFQLYIANRGDNSAKFSIEFNDLIVVESGKKGLTKTDCGSILISYPNIPIDVASGHGASLPFIVKATRVSKSCSFVTTATLINNNDGQKYKTPVVIRVE